ncbi:MAG: low molecular weight protein arginine phosphatase [Gemmatimonadetes bacterium]|nr:low molecular weight protein arginine phosphatase [Gemmatimonadota bacterium]
MKTILLVCTGNICRSPLAQVLLQRDLDETHPGEFRVVSAGTGAWDGASASEGAYLVSLENSLDVSMHRAQLLTRELTAESDLILTMARHHRVRALEVGGSGKTFLLGEYAGETGPEAEVADPFGGDINVYRETFAELRDLVARAMKRLTAEFHESGTGEQ